MISFTMPALKHRLLLTYSSECLDSSPLLVSSNSTPLPWARKEAAGHSFHEAARRKVGCSESDKEDEITPPEKKKAESPSVDSYHFKGKKKNNPDGYQQDHYALLGLSHLRFLATEEQIRKSYRDVALKHHPDKQALLLSQEECEDSREAKKEEIDRYFKSIQEAYEILTDPAKRRLYDSIDEFDDEVPSECVPDDFFKVFGPVFLRNGRWSISQPVPSIGDDSTSISEVDAFYDFWWSFKSWREFPHADEFDMDQAESREHKRWMERQNGKLREKAKKEENGRIRTLIENAYKRDPRILRRKEEAKAEKLRKKQAKILAKQEKELEATRVVEEERLRKVEEDRKVSMEVAAHKKVREKEKKLLRKERQRLRAASGAVCAQKDFHVSEDAIESLCTSLEMSEMTVLCEALENCKGVEKQAEILRVPLKGTAYEKFFPGLSDASSVCRFDQVESRLDGNTLFSHECLLNAGLGQSDKGGANGCKGWAERSEQVSKVSGALNGGEQKEKPWAKEEVELLRKAVAKYPKGTSQRWEVVSDYVGTGRTVDEILRAIKTVLLQKPDPSKAFDSFLSKRKAAKVINSPLSTRESVNAGASAACTFPTLVDNNGNKDVVGCFRKEKPEKLTNLVTCEEEGPSVDIGVPDPDCQTNGNVTAVAIGKSGDIDREAWTEMQELALVKALKTFPKDMSQRWERIAAAVPSKTKTQCFKKFAELRENFRSKKGID